MQVDRGELGEDFLRDPNDKRPEVSERTLDGAFPENEPAARISVEIKSAKQSQREKSIVSSCCVAEALGSVVPFTVK